MVRLQKKKPCWEKFTNNFFEGVLKINNNNNKKNNNTKDHSYNEPDNNFAVEVIGLAGNLAVIGVMVMDRRTRLLMVILVMVMIMVILVVIFISEGKTPPGKKLKAQEVPKVQKCCV